MIEHPEISKNPAVEDHLHRLQEVHLALSHHLHTAQATHKKAADRHCLDSSPKEPKFQIGDRVWLLRRNVKTTRPCDKLDYQRLGPFINVYDVAFRLDLPPHMHLHLVFHVSLLEPYIGSSIPDRVVLSPPLLGNMSLRMEDTENSLISERASIGSDRLEGHICKYPESHICINMT